MVFFLAFQFNIARIPKGIGVGGGWSSRFRLPGFRGSGRGLAQFVPIRTDRKRERSGAKIGHFSWICHKCVVTEFIDRKNDGNFLSSSEQVVPNSRTTVDLTTFTPETLSRKLHSLF